AWQQLFGPSDGCHVVTVTHGTDAGGRRRQYLAVVQTDWYRSADLGLVGEVLGRAGGATRALADIQGRPHENRRPHAVDERRQSRHPHEPSRPQAARLHVAAAWWFP